MREASKAEAASWFGEHHYTGTAGGSRFFVVDERVMVGIGRGGNRYGVGDKFGLTAWRGDWEITRVACLPFAPRNSASKAVAAVCHALAGEGLEWLFSYSDTAQGHHGGIYQALNAIYVGTDAKQWVNFALNGKRVAKRAVSGRYGHTRWPEVRELAAAQGDTLERVSWCPKLTYIIPVAAKPSVRRAIRKALAPIALPYPKRADNLAALATPYRNHRA